MATFWFCHDPKPRAPKFVLPYPYMVFMIWFFLKVLTMQKSSCSFMTHTSCLSASIILSHCLNIPRISCRRLSLSLVVRLAKLGADKVLTAPCETSVLYPKEGGNLHCFTAVTPCAVLDVLSPPYKEDAGRKCTYYHDYPYSTFG